MTGFDGLMLKIPLIPALLIFMSNFNFMLKKRFYNLGARPTRTNRYGPFLKFLGACDFLPIPAQNIDPAGFARSPI